ncbi:YVTN family beta-propeller repeat protein [Methanosarcina siciliae]|nr:Ig-like domain repeat protein [Methanosarcina siciliae]
MAKGDKEYSLFSASIAFLLLLVIFSSTELISAAQSDSYTEYAYVPNEKSNTVSLINTTTNTVISTLLVGNVPCGVAFSPDGQKVYVTNFGDDNSPGRYFSVIDTATQEVTDQLVEGFKPSGIAVIPDGTLYVACYSTNDVYAIDLATNNVSKILVGLHPREVTAVTTPDGLRIYVANRHSNDISVIDTTTNTVVTNVGVGTEPYGIAVSSLGTKLYVTNQGSGNVSVIDTATNKVTANITVEKYPSGIAVTPDEKWVYVANKKTPKGTVSVISTSNNTVIKTIDVGNKPSGVAVTSDGKCVYVTNSGSNTTSVINTTTNIVILTIPVGIRPSGLGQFIGHVVGSRIETKTTLVSLSNQQSGKTKELQATVNATSGTEIPSGTVIFMDANNPIKNGNKDVISGQAILDISSLPVGSHSITARYIGNDKFRPSTSSSFPLSIDEGSHSGNDSKSDYTNAIIGAVAVVLSAIIGLYGAYLKRKEK